MQNRSVKIKCEADPFDSTLGSGWYFWLRSSGYDTLRYFVLSVSGQCLNSRHSFIDYSTTNGFGDL
jgi:hypothetical protein